MIPERFEELTKEQTEEFARFGFEVYSSIRRQCQASDVTASRVQHISRQQQELQRELNSLAQPVHDKIFL